VGHAKVGEPAVRRRAVVGHGRNCLCPLNSKAFGSYASPGFVETVFLGIPVAGVPTILHRANGTDSAEELLSIGGLVSKFYAEGMVSAAVNAHYGTERAAQIEYAPHSTPEQARPPSRLGSPRPKPNALPTNSQCAGLSDDPAA
jgi:hypothetical protein